MVKNLEAYQIHKENCGGLTWRRKTKGHVVEEELASRAENRAQTKTIGGQILVPCKERTFSAEATQSLECFFIKHKESSSINGAQTLSDVVMMEVWLKKASFGNRESNLF